MQPTKQFTGEGFKGERLLAIIVAVTTIVSTLMLIELTIMQREHTKLQLDEAKKKPNNKDNQTTI